MLKHTQVSKVLHVFVLKLVAFLTSYSSTDFARHAVFHCDLVFGTVDGSAGGNLVLVTSSNESH